MDSSLLQTDGSLNADVRRACGALGKIERVIITLNDKIAEQAGTIASLHKSNDEMGVLISSQDYQIKKLKAELADMKEATRPAGQTWTGVNTRYDSTGVDELAKFEAQETADDGETALFEKMRQRKALLNAPTPDAETRDEASGIKARIRAFVNKRVVAPTTPAAPMLRPSHDIEPIDDNSEFVL